MDAQGNFVPAQAGFNLADVTSVAQLNALPDGVKGLIWLDEGHGVTQDFIDKVTPFIGNPKLYGFFLKDEPDVTGKWGPLVTAADLKAESDWIHANVPGAKTFITMMNMGTAANPTYANTYTPENTHIDLFGITGYPVRSESSSVDYDMIDRNVAAAQAVGISTDQIVPVYQTFGGGNWVTEHGGHYVMPTVAQQQEMFQHWEALVPNPAFDYAYAWGSQNGDVALESSQALKDLFLQHNNSDGGGTTPPVVDPPPAVDPPPVVDAGGHGPDDANAGTPPAGGATDPTTPTDPTPVNHFPGWNGGHGAGLDFSHLLGFVNGGRHWSELVQNDGSGHSPFGIPQNGGGGFSWHGLNGLTQLASGDASSSGHSAESSDGSARFGMPHSGAAAASNAALSHVMDSLPENFGRLADHWHW